MHKIVTDIEATTKKLPYAQKPPRKNYTAFLTRYRTDIYLRYLLDLDLILQYMVPNDKKSDKKPENEKI